MKSIVRWSIALVMVGIFALIFTRQTQNDAVLAQGNKPIMMYRFYEGKDGLSHYEMVELKGFDEHNVAQLIPVEHAEVHVTKPDPPGKVFEGTYHPGPHRQYIFNLMGHERIQFSGGQEIMLNPGDIELIEDTAPSKGHRNITPGPVDRVTVFVPLKDQTVVRDSILKK